MTVPEGETILFRDSVWLRRLPRVRHMGGGAGDGGRAGRRRVAGLQTFLDAGSALRVVAANLASFDGGITLGAGETLIYDTRAVADNTVFDSPLNTYTVTHAVTLNGGT